MPNCRLCGKPVDSSPVFHDKCLTELINSVKCQICDNYCRIPHMGLAPVDMEAACEHCPLDRLDKIGE